MFESEVYIKEIQESLPDSVLESFSETKQNLTHRSLLHWTEHCTECAMPDCFKTCDLYAPRIDGKCQRFLNGIEIVKSGTHPEIRLIKIQFKKWGVLATQGSDKIYNLEEINKKEKKDLRIGNILKSVKPKWVRKKLIQKRYSIKKNELLNSQHGRLDIPDGFLIEVYNPTDNQLEIGLTIRSEDPKYRILPFQYKISVKSGYSKDVIPFGEIEKRVNLKYGYRINLTPESIDSTTPLYFGNTEFVKFKENDTIKHKSKKTKCVVWDLDNTIWHGILVESKLNDLKLRKNITEILSKLESAGIINCIASKNNEDEALKALKHFGISDYFLYPKISWQPKSTSIKSIALDLNIGLDTLLFVDDSEFERKEVEAVLPNVTTMDAEDCLEILNLPELSTNVTAESKQRKKLYQNEKNRKDVSENFEGDYFDFLKSCNIHLKISSLTPASYDRVHELAQRTNQMNFSGNRYKREDILKIANNEQFDNYVMSCIDKFGDYGIIGFGIVDRSVNQLIDLMFSCRVQSKRIEHAFLNHCLQKYLGKGDFYAKYRYTNSNRFTGQVFDDLGFLLESSNDEGMRILRYPAEKDILHEKIINITA